MRTIAVIEDDAPIGDLLEEALRGEGYGVLRAYSGTEAQYLLARHTPDLVLLDLMLPGRSGEELLPLLRGPVQGEEPRLTFQDLVLDPAAHAVTAGGQPVKLTKTEYAILHLLLANPRQVLAKSVILDRISQETPDGTERSLKQHMSNLRKKLRQAGGREYIQAVWGIGFCLTGEGS